MRNVFQLSPEELFFMGKQMRARYIDYDYIRLMPDIQQQYAVQEREIMAGLEKKGFLMEDFSGNIELEKKAAEALHAVFFGAFESEAILMEAAKETQAEHLKFHFENNGITAVRMQKRQLIFLPDGKSELSLLGNKVFSEGYRAEQAAVLLDELDVSQLSRVLTLKNMWIGKRTQVWQFLELDGIWFGEKGENLAQAQTAEQMRSIWSRIMEGADRDGLL